MDRPACPVSILAPLLHALDTRSRATAKMTDGSLVELVEGEDFDLVGNAFRLRTPTAAEYVTFSYPWRVTR